MPPCNPPILTPRRVGPPSWPGWRTQGSEASEPDRVNPLKISELSQNREKRTRRGYLACFQSISSKKGYFSRQPYVSTLQFNQSSRSLRRAPIWPWESQVQGGIEKPRRNELGHSWNVLQNNGERGRESPIVSQGISPIAARGITGPKSGFYSLTFPDFLPIIGRNSDLRAARLGVGRSVRAPGNNWSSVHNP